jgi:CRP-like cAMP-binding protein
MFIHLSKSPLFKGFSPQQTELLIKKAKYQIRSYEAEQLVAQRGEDCNKLIILLDGNVRGEMLDFSGKILKVEDISAPKAIATGFIFGAKNNFPVDVVANTDVTCMILPKEEVLALFKLSQEFLINFLDVVSNRAQFLSQRIWFLSFKTIKGKLAQYILNLAGDNKRIVQLPVQRELADFFGVTRPSLARALGEMEKEGSITVNRKEITIADKNALIRLLE